MLELTTWRRFGAPLVIVATVLVTSGYIGPGAGTGAILVLVAVVLGVLLLLVGLFWYPAKRMVRARRGGKPAEEDDGG